MNWAELTSETIAKAEKWFIDNALDCIAEAESGKVYVNDLEAYKARQMATAMEYMNKTYRPSFTFLQRAWYIQTGESVAFLP